MAREKPFATEGALCEAFAEWARAEGFTVYPETAGWDMLLVAADGHQLGIEAKLSLNLKVLAQALKGCTYSAERGPDYRAILVPESHDGVDDICTHFRHDEINPPAGLGWCPLRKVSRYPGQPHYCKQREEEEDEHACLE